jgi:uncharacterized cupin superfamily protein
MHRTRTVDYAVVLSGEIDMMLDDSVVHVRAGDVIVQQATNHAWINRGTQPCRNCLRSSIRGNRDQELVRTSPAAPSRCRDFSV